MIPPTDLLGISNLVCTLPTTLPKFDQISSCQGNKLSVRSMVTGEVVCSVDAKVVPNLGGFVFFFFKCFGRRNGELVFF